MNVVGFLVKAGRETGYGHVIRCLALADELKARGFRCVFRGNDEAVGRAVRYGYEPAANQDFHSDVWVVDLEGGCPPDVAQHYREHCDVLVILNGVGYPDGDPGRLLADLVFYQGVTDRPRQLDWTGFDGEWFVGPEWLILRREFRTHKASPGPHATPRIVVAAGGSDPKDITGKVLLALKDTTAQVRAIVGPANHSGLGWNPRNTELMLDPPNMAEALAWADLAIASYGMTAFECLALGLPVIALSISADHELSAQLVQRDCAALFSLGQVENVQPLDIFWTVRSMMETPELSETARAYVDGRGAERVADKIIKTLSPTVGTWEVKSAMGE